MFASRPTLALSASARLHPHRTVEQPEPSIDAYRARLHALGWVINSEHSDLAGGGRIVWLLTCRREGDEHVARGETPREAWRNAVLQAEALC